MATGAFTGLADYNMIGVIGHFRRVPIVALLTALLSSDFLWEGRFFYEARHLT